MFTRLVMWGSYVFLLAVLLPHTAWQFSLFEPEQTKGLGWAAAVAFELTIGALTHLLARELAVLSDKQDEVFAARLKRELLNIPSILLMVTIMVSTLANWTHAFTFGENLPYGENILVKLIYSVMFGAVLPLCSFSYAYVLSKIYRKDIVVTRTEDEVWTALTTALRQNPQREITPRYLSRISGVDEATASQVITEAVKAGIISSNGKV